MSAVAPGDDTLYTGDTVLNHAADLATLLCLGAASQVLDDGDLQAGQVPGSPNSVNRVYQVFRNWNLDRRRENEWKMLIAGGAISEKRGDATALDPALPPLPAAGGPGAWTLRTGRGEAPSNRMGWVPAMRSWLDMARRPSTNTKSKSAFKPGDPPNLDLSRALAYLLDMRDPDPAP